MAAKKRTLKAPTESGKIARVKIRTAISGVHVTPIRRRGWAVRKIGAGRLMQEFPSKQDAVVFARTLGKQQKSKLIIHGRDGRIEQIDSHGSAGRSGRVSRRNR